METEVTEIHAHIGGLHVGIRKKKMIYAHINEENNQLLGWYDDTIHTSIPTPNIQVTQSQWQNSIDNNHNKVNSDGSTETYEFRTVEEIKNAIRAERDFILEAYVDPLVSNSLRWNDLTNAQRTAWTQYRTDLLNVPQQVGFPYDITWPTKPS